MTRQPDARAAVGPQKYDWLRRQIGDWRARGIVSAEQGDRILQLYSPVGRLSAARATFGVTGLAVLMAAVALLLVIAYSWDTLVPAARVAIVLAMVCGAFGASAVAYRRAHPRLGEILAFGGTLLYGNGIFLLAGVFHIRTHDPDGLLWWMAGTLVTAILLRSRLIALTALALLLFWVPFESVEYQRPNYWFLPAAAAAAWLAVGLRSAGLLGLTAAIAALWLLVTGAFAFDEGLAAFGPVLALGAAYSSVGRRGRRDDGLGGALTTAGLGTIFVALLPLMSVGVHEGVGVDTTVAWPMFIMATAFAAIAVGLPVATSRRLTDWPVLVSAGFAVAWVTAVWTMDVTRAVAVVLAVGASAIALAFAVWLMRGGARTGSLPQFAAGAAFALGFVGVRWASAVGNLLWSALILALASALLLWMAWLWRSAPSEPGEAAGPALSGERPPHGVPSTADLPAPAARVVVAATLCLSVLAGMLVIHAWPLWTGRTVYLRVESADPRDALRSGLVTLRYAFDAVCVAPNECTDTRDAGSRAALGLPARGGWVTALAAASPIERRRWDDRPVYLLVGHTPTGLEHPATVASPLALGDRPEPNTVFLRGRLRRARLYPRVTVDLGLDGVYLTRGAAPELEAAVAAGTPIFAEVAVAPDGRARVRALLFDGRRYE